MFSRRVVFVGALVASALFPIGMVRAQVLTLSDAQARALGVRFDPVAAAAQLETGASARVVLKPDAQYVVAAPYAGMVSRVLVSIGQAVRAGQPLATFASPQLFEAGRALSEARSQANLARLALARDRGLHDDGIIPGSRWQATQARAAEGAAMVRAREAEMAAAGIVFAAGSGEPQLVAGRAGLIAEVNAVPGTRVEGAAPLFRIVDPTALELDLLVGRDVPAPTGGERVEVRQRGATGTVAGVVPASDGTAAVRVRAVLDKRGSLQAGESVNVIVHLRSAPDASGAGRVRMPAMALTYWRGTPGVFVATKTGVRYQTVVVEAVDDAAATVRGPLPAGTRVAVAGVGALKGMLAGGQ
ncbi:efflux RND transporter periplasmic adaptor subunit [Cupriavidus basilensis]|uniref:efflux RND transporter periplasmic adaptor subunit n=1 Tax=Cupriavidus basilensis TaxID=68895 RepID=UPI0020A67A2D|nr:efflux RND transporter periplasmic adaptor subunit [Cupriavidus basilensis]MCP3023851.1 efflux RND transporter periplasmic adaptor subunit [Cupriavidus basilensis]